jgi:hypothetical protein
VLIFNAGKLRSLSIHNLRFHFVTVERDRATAEVFVKKLLCLAVLPTVFLSFFFGIVAGPSCVIMRCCSRLAEFRSWCCSRFLDCLNQDTVVVIDRYFYR